MFRCARLVCDVISRLKASKIVNLARFHMGMESKSLAALRYIKPITLCSASAVVFATCSPKQKTPPLLAKEISVITKKADDLFNENRYEEVLTLLRPYKDSEIEEIIWRISRAAFNLSKSKTIDKVKHSALVEESYEMAKLTLELNENSAPGHKWMAITLDAHSNLQGFRSRCATLIPVLDHSKRSMEIDPTDATVIHIVGMWYYSIADLAWYQKSILQAIVGKIPACSYEEALLCFRRAEDVSPNFYSMNLLMLGKSYLKLGDKDSAIAYLQRVVNYPKFTDEDHQAHQEASDLLKKVQAP